MSKLIQRCVLVTSLSFVASAVYSATNYSGYSMTPFPLLPRLSVTGLAGTETLGFADAMAPLLGSREGDLYADLEGKAGNDHAWMGSAGLGYRQVVNCSDILGAYLFIDRNQTADQNRFWILSPGIESLGTSWDFRANGYIPLSSKHVFDHRSFGDELGMSQFVFFTGHQQFDRLFNFYEEVGPGADAEVGKIFCNLHRLAIYGGGYYFNLQDNSNIKGGEVRAEFPVTQYATLLVNDTYDNHQHNTIEAGIRLTLGGMHCPATSYDVHNRLLDPVMRNLGALHTGAGIPSLKVRDNGTTRLERDNIWFFNQGNTVFDPAAGTANCTFEHPCGNTQFVQTTVDTIDTIAKGANFYFTPGGYPLTPAPASHNPVPNGYLGLKNGQNMWGRTADYRMAAQGDIRAIFTGGLNPLGNNHIDSIQLQNDGSVAFNEGAIAIVNANNVVLTNDKIGTKNNIGSYQEGMFLSEAQNIIISNSEINALTNDTINTSAIGIQAFNSSFNINHSTINSTADIETSGLALTANSFGINAINTSVEINDSAINTLAKEILDPITGNASALSFGIFITNAPLQIRNSIINTNATAQGDMATILSPTSDIFATNSVVNIENSNLIVRSSANATTLATLQNVAGMELDNSVLNFERSNLDLISTAQSQGNSSINEATGLDVTNSSVNIDKCRINVNTQAQSISGTNAFSSLIRMSGASSKVDISKSSLNDTVAAQATTGTVNSAIPPAINADLGTLDITKSIINLSATANGSSGLASLQGILSSGGSINFENSQIIADVVGNGPTVQSSMAGLINASDATVNLNSSLLDANVITNGDTSPINANNGIFISGGDFNMNNSIFKFNSVTNGNNSPISAVGIFILSGTHQINNSTIETDGTTQGDNSSVNLIGVVNQNSSTLTIDRSWLKTAAATNGNTSDINVQGISIESGGILNLQKSELETSGVTNGNNSVTGITVDGTLNMDKSILETNATTIGDNTQTLSFGIDALNGSTLNLTKSSIIAGAVTAGANGFNQTTAITGNNNIIDITHCVISASNISNGINSPANASGIFVSNNSVLNVDNSIINSFALATQASASSAGIGGAGSIISANNNIFDIHVQAQGIASAQGVGVFANAVATVDNNFFDISASSEQNSAFSTAFFSGAGSSINASNNSGIIAAFAPNGTAIATSAVMAGGVVTEVNDNFIIIPPPPSNSIKLADNEFDLHYKL